MTKDVSFLPESKWVDVMTPEGVRSDSGFCSFGSPVFVLKGGQVVVEAIDGDDFLVRYYPPDYPGPGVYGLTHPVSMSVAQGDLLFFIPQETFQDWKDKYLAQEKAKEELKRHVQELLERAKKGTENDESGRDPTAYSC